MIANLYEFNIDEYNIDNIKIYFNYRM